MVFVRIGKDETTRPPLAGKQIQREPFSPSLLLFRLHTYTAIARLLAGKNLIICETIARGIMIIASGQSEKTLGEAERGK